MGQVMRGGVLYDEDDDTRTAMDQMRGERPLGQPPMTAMRGGGDLSYMNFPNVSDIDMDRVMVPPEKSSRGRSAMMAMGALVGGGNPVSAYYGDQYAQEGRAMEGQRRGFAGSRLEEEMGGGDRFVSDLERMQEFYVEKSLGGNPARPQPRGSTFGETRTTLPSGDVQVSPYAQNAGRIQYGDQSTIRNQAGAASLQRRAQLRDLSDEAIQGLWNEYGILGGGDATGPGNIFQDNTRNLIAGREIQQYIDDVQYNPYEVGTEAWKLHDVESKELYDKIMAPLSGFGDVALTADEKRLAALAAMGMGPEGAPISSQEGVDSSQEIPAIPEYVPQSYEQMGRGLLPALGAGLYEKGEQLLSIPGKAIGWLQEHSEPLDADWRDRQPAFGSMTSPAHDREMEERYGPMRDRPVPAFLRGIGKGFTEPLGAFLFGDQSASSPAAVDDVALNAELLGQYTWFELSQMSEAQKQEALEKIRLGGNR
jgi:hypothetical protein